MPNTFKLLEQNVHNSFRSIVRIYYRNKTPYQVELFIEKIFFTASLQITIQKYYIVTACTGTFLYHQIND